MNKYKELLETVKEFMKKGTEDKPSRLITLYPSLVDICEGKITPALLLSQLLFWTDKGDDKKAGWVVKPASEWYSENRLTKDMIESSAKILERLGFIEIGQVPFRAHNTNKYRVILENVLAALKRVKEENPIGKSENTIGDAENPIGKSENPATITEMFRDVTEMFREPVSTSAKPEVSTPSDSSKQESSGQDSTNLSPKNRDSILEKELNPDPILKRKYKSRDSSNKKFSQNLNSIAHSRREINPGKFNIPNPFADSVPDLEKELI